MKCSSCKNENPSDSMFCQYCGEKIIAPVILTEESEPAQKKKSKISTLAIVLAIVLALSLGLNTYLGYQYVSSKKLIEQLQADIATRVESMNKMSLDLRFAQEQNDFFNESTGLIPDNGRYYHTYNCPDWQAHISQLNYGYYILNKEWARSEGYRPCPKCQ